MSLFLRANSCLLPSSRVFGSLGGQSKTKKHIEPAAKSHAGETTFTIEKFLTALVNALRIYV